MPRFDETVISKAIVGTYAKKLLDRIESDVLIVGAGPAGMTAAQCLADKGLKVTIIEKRLSPGGGIWGGGMAMNEVVIQENVLPLLKGLGVGCQLVGDGFYTVDSVELAVGLCFKALKSGAVLFNLMTVQDVCVHKGRVVGVVVNRSLVGDSLPVDPITFSAKAVIDGTGHEAAVVQTLRGRGLLQGSAFDDTCEGPMDAASGEDFVANKVAEVYPGLWVSGMSVCAAVGGPRMGPIFGGMLLSGIRVADLICEQLGRSTK